MRDLIRAKVTSGRPIDRAEAAWLHEQADLDTLSELATVARDRWHPSGRATYLIMAIVNTTNVCVAKCDYCAFYRLPGQAGAYTLPLETVCERIEALRQHGGTLIGFNGGFHPKITLHDQAELFRTVRDRFPDLEFYEMTVAEFMFFCKVGKVSYDEGARRLAEVGTRWITGGGAEILQDDFRRRHSPLKYRVEDFYAAQRAILDAGMGSTATMVIGFDETLQERLDHLERLRRFQDDTGGRLPSFLCWTYKPSHTELGGDEVGTEDYLRWLAVSRVFLHNIPHVRTSVLTRNAEALKGLRFGADDFDLPTEDEVTESAGATISHDFEGILQGARAVGYEPLHRAPWPVPDEAACPL